MLVGFPVATLRAEHRNGRAAAHQAGVVGGDLEASAVPEFGHLAGRAHNLSRQQRGPQQTFAVFPQNVGLLLVGAEQDDNRALACALVLPPVSAAQHATPRQR
jgi:hypothetical protein